MPEFKLYYFELYGRAEPIRMMLAHSGADWEDIIKTGDDWKAFKPTIPGGQMPILELADGTMMGQSMAIARFVGKKYGYYPADPMAAYHVDNIIDIAGDVLMNMVKPAFAPAEAKEALTTECFETHAPKFLACLDQYIKDDGFLVGDSLTLADFLIGGLYCNIMTNPKGRYGIEDGKWAEFLAKYPKFEAYGKRFAEAIKGWLEKRNKNCTM